MSGDFGQFELFKDFQESKLHKDAKARPWAYRFTVDAWNEDGEPIINDVESETFEGAEAQARRHFKPGCFAIVPVPKNEGLRHV